MLGSVAKHCADTDNDTITHKVFVVRECDSNAGCCVNIGGPDFANTRAEMVRIGGVYEALYAAFGNDIELTVIDPRNTAYMIPTIYRLGRRRGLGRMEALRQVARSSANGAVVVDGKVIFDGKIPVPPAEVVEGVRDEFDATASA
jgi:hypothetical protein